MTTNSVSGTTGLIVEQLASCGVKLVASLPDDWVAELIKAIDADPRFRHVPVNREESAIGLCSGAYFGGVPSLALMGASGLMTCIYALTKINYTYQVPLLLFITLRGAIGDPRNHHVSNGLYLEPVMQAMSLQYTVVDSAGKIPVIAEAYGHSRVMGRPVAVAFTRAVLKGPARAGGEG
jgi:sulfopyruvate decarboxylase TPP-binding subunit